MARKKSGRPTLTIEQRERAMAALNKLLHERFDGNQAKLAEAIGIAPPSLNAYFAGHASPSLHTLRAIAKVAGESTAEALIGESVGASVDSDDPYPLRRELTLLSEWREAPLEVRQAVLQIRNKRGDYQRIDDWLSELRSAKRRYERGELEALREGEEVVAPPSENE